MSLPTTFRSTFFRCESTSEGTRLAYLADIDLARLGPEAVEGVARPEPDRGPHAAHRRRELRADLRGRTGRVCRRHPPRVLARRGAAPWCHPNSGGDGDGTTCGDDERRGIMVMGRRRWGGGGGGAERPPTF